MSAATHCIPYNPDCTVCNPPYEWPDNYKPIPPKATFRRGAMKLRSLYMHLMDDRPAYLERGESLVYAGRIFPASGFCQSLDELKRQRAQSIGWRRRELHESEDASRYDYVRIVLENGKL